jgi:hypothetical protein
MKEFLKTTIIGGALFLLPVALVLLVLNHAMQLAGKVVRPISHNLHFDRAVTGISIATVLAVEWLGRRIRTASSPAHSGQRDGRIRPLNISMLQARSIVKHIGIGSGEALRGINLTTSAG